MSKYILILLISVNLVNISLCCGNNKQKFTIGALFEDSCHHVMQIFQQTLHEFNSLNDNYCFQSSIKIIYETEDIMAIKKAVCDLISLESGVIAIFEVLPSYEGNLIQSITSIFKIPLIQIYWKPTYTKVNYKTTNLNFHPDNDLLSKGLSTVVKNLQWKKYIILYEDKKSLFHLQDVLKISGTDNPIFLQKLMDGDDQRPILKQLADSKVKKIILHCHHSKILKILQQANESHLLEHMHSYFLTSLDSHLIDFSVLNTRSNITYVKFFNESYERYENSTTSEVLMSDALNHFLNAFTSDDNLINNIRPEGLRCNEDLKFEFGLDIVDALKKYKYEDAISRPLNFDQNGSRTEFELHLIEASPNSTKLSIWSPENPDQMRNLWTKIQLQQRARFMSLQTRSVVVTTREGAPYLIKEKHENGSYYYDGFSKDLMDKIAERIGFEYEFRQTETNAYGKLDPETGQWDGIIGDIVNGKAQLGICDLTITHLRRQAVDFSLPFMSLGIGILYKETEKEGRNVFAFMDPLSLEVWMFTATLYLIISILLSLIARVDPGDWEKPHPCDDNPEEKENIWNLKNCFWLTLGSIMTQGSDILPKGICSRMTTALWWFFSLLITSTYTANLAAFLTKDKMELKITSAEDLLKSDIKYGSIKGGATEAFFKTSNFSTYQRMFLQMQQFKPNVFESKNEDGVRKVLNTPHNKFAFFMESVSIEYEKEKHCKLTQIGNNLDDKGYGIAMPIDAPYRDDINDAILYFQEHGTLLELKTKWWKTKVIGENCDDLVSSTSSIDQQRLGLANVGGVFIVLSAGVFLAFIISLVEFLWNVKTVAVEEHITYWEALCVEVKFLINVTVTKKATKIPTPSSSNRSTRAQSLVEGVINNARSLLRLDILEKYAPTAKNN